MEIKSDLPHTSMKSAYQRTIALVLLVILFVPSNWIHAEDQAEESRVLNSRLDATMVVEPIKPVGTTTDEQFLNVLEQLSNLYSIRWNSRLPIRIDLRAWQQLRTSSIDLSTQLGLVMRDVPTKETLVYWCGLADLKFTVTHGAVLIVPVD